MAEETYTLNIKRFLVWSTGEDVQIPDPNDLETAVKLRDELQAKDKFETWEIIAEIKS